MSIVKIGVSAIRSGKRSGKDTFADYAIEYINNLGASNLKPLKISFAEPLKRMCEILGLSYEEMNGTEQQKESPTQWKWHESNKYNKSGNMTNREVLQYVGSDLFRNQFDSDVWVKCLDSYILGLSKKEVIDKDLIVFIPDVRFPNEFSILDYAIDIDRSNNIKIDRDLHISEQAARELPDETFDIRVFNWGEKEKVKTCAIQFLNEYILKDGEINLSKRPYKEYYL